MAGEKTALTPTPAAGHDWDSPCQPGPSPPNTNPNQKLIDFYDTVRSPCSQCAGLSYNPCHRDELRNARLRMFSAGSGRRVFHPVFYDCRTVCPHCSPRSGRRGKQGPTDATLCRIDGSCRCCDASSGEQPMSAPQGKPLPTRQPKRYDVWYSAERSCNSSLKPPRHSKAIVAVVFSDKTAFARINSFPNAQSRRKSPAHSVHSLAFRSLPVILNEG